MLWLATAVERAMNRQEVILRALSGALSWLQAADILGIDPRSLRRWRARYEADQMSRKPSITGVSGLSRKTHR
jgi:hypothetical protein